MVLCVEMAPHLPMYEHERVLDELRRGGRTVGVISHLEELRTRIPTRLEVIAGAPHGLNLTHKDEFNRLLLELTLDALHAAGLRVLVPETLPPNDGQIAFGQVAVAAARQGAQGLIVGVGSIQYPPEYEAADPRSLASIGVGTRIRWQDHLYGSFDLGVPLVTQHYPDRIANRIGEAAAAAGATWLPRGGIPTWSIAWRWQASPGSWRASDGWWRWTGSRRRRSRPTAHGSVRGPAGGATAAAAWTRTAATSTPSSCSRAWMLRLKADWLKWTACAAR